MKYVVDVRGELPKECCLSNATPLKRVSAQLEDLAGEVCEKLCKYKQQAEAEGRPEEWLWENCCDSCPINMYL